ncbi:hypothetical protein F5H01DRAFT_364264 [Linnemannia elongata]|nr:hypothetical protein F5H01DRAFT_364264 [Linnemannia elongata]
MGNIFSTSHHQEQTAAAAVAAAATAERQHQLRLQRQLQLQRQRQQQERKAEQERQRQELELEQEQEKEKEKERLLQQQAKAQAALSLRNRNRSSLVTRPSFYDKKCDDDSYAADRDWEWYFDRAQTYNDDSNGLQDDQGYTGSDGYYRIPQHQRNHHHHHTHHRQTQGGHEYTWRGLKKSDKAYTTSPTGNGRRKRCRKGKKGDLYENDYHAGYSKPEILAMSSERKAAFEVQKLRRQRHEGIVSA